MWVVKTWHADDDPRCVTEDHEGMVLAGGFAWHVSTRAFAGGRVVRIWSRFASLMSHIYIAFAL